MWAYIYTRGSKRVKEALFIMSLSLLKLFNRGNLMWAYIYTRGSKRVKEALFIMPLSLL